jgi:hypothetical protein
MTKAGEVSCIRMRENALKLLPRNHPVQVMLVRILDQHMDE